MTQAKECQALPGSQQNGEEKHVTYSLPRRMKGTNPADTLIPNSWLPE